MSDADDPAFPGLTVNELCLGFDEGVYGEVRDASECTRAQAMRAYQSEVGCLWTEIRCVVRYIAIYTRQELWEGPGRDRAADDLQAESWGKLTLEEAFAQVPTQVPDGWRPEEYMPCWRFVPKTHPRAQRAWCLEVRGDDRIPPQPR